MNVRMRLFIGIIMILAIIYVWQSIRKKRIDIRHALVWLIVAAVLLVMDIFPALLEGLSMLLGFELPVNMLFFLGFLLAIVIIFSLSAKVSKLSEQVKTLAQDVAIQSEEIEKWKKEHEKDSF